MKARLTTAAVILFTASFGFAQTQPATSPATAETKSGPAARRAVCHLHAVGDSGVSGTVWFTEEAGKIRVTADLKGLTPGDHGFHIHEYGDCSAADATSAGGHFNPTAHPHGAPAGSERHAGDLGNIKADEHGNASLDLLDGHLEFDGAGSILGRGMIVHAKADDLTTQPTGAAGARVGCGVIGVGK